MGKMKTGLSPKQRLFARCIASGSGMSLADAYREAYDAENMSPAAIRTEASKLASHPDITLMVEQIKSQERRAQLAQTTSDKERVLQRLRELSASETEIDSGDGTRLRAVELLGKASGVFAVSGDDSEVTKTSSELMAELEVMLESVASDQPMPEESEPVPDTTIMH